MADQDRNQTVDRVASLINDSQPNDEDNTAAANETLAAEPTEAISLSSASATSLEPDVSLNHNQAS